MPNEMDSPPGATLTPLADGVEISMRWSRAGAGAFFAFAAFWLGIDGTLFAAFLAGMSAADPEFLLILAFFIVHSSVGFVMLYLGLTRAFNRVRVRASRSQGIDLRIGPIPGRGARRIGPGQLRALAVVARPTGKGQDYDLVAIGPGAPRAVLLRGAVADDVEWLKATLDRALRLPGTPSLPPRSPAPAPVAPTAAPSESSELCIAQSAEGLVLSRPWAGKFALVIYVIAWAIFGGAQAGALLIQVLIDAVRGADASVLASAEGVLAIIGNGIAMAIGYIAFAAAWNRTTITVARGGMLAVRAGPVPWPEGPTIPSAEIEQLFVREHKRTNKGKTSFSYSVHVKRRHQRQSVGIADGLANREIALQLERAIEHWLGIRNRVVDDAIRSGPDDVVLPMTWPVLPASSLPAPPTRQAMATSLMALLVGLPLLAFGIERCSQAGLESDAPAEEAVAAPAEAPSPPPVPPPVQLRIEQPLALAAQPPAIALALAALTPGMAINDAANAIYAITKPAGVDDPFRYVAREDFEDFCRDFDEVWVFRSAPGASAQVALFARGGWLSGWMSFDYPSRRYGEWIRDAVLALYPIPAEQQVHDEAGEGLSAELFEDWDLRLRKAYTGLHGDLLSGDAARVRARLGHFLADHFREHPDAEAGFAANLTALSKALPQKPEVVCTVVGSDRQHGHLLYNATWSDPEGLPVLLQGAAGLVPEQDQWLANVWRGGNYALP